MRTYTKKFHVRCFNAGVTPDNCKGVMSDHGTVIDVDEKYVDGAISLIRTMMDFRYQNDDQGGTKISFDILIDDDPNAAVPSRKDPLRQEIMNVLTRWAEKSRIKGLRGWRINAVREPIFKLKDDGLHAVTTVIIGNNVRYSPQLVSVYDRNKHLTEDLGNLIRKLKKRGWRINRTKHTYV